MDLITIEYFPSVEQIDIRVSFREKVTKSLYTQTT